MRTNIYKIDIFYESIDRVDIDRTPAAQTRDNQKNEE